MKAVRIHEFGGPEVLCYEDAPCPEPKAGELLVRVHATAINPADCKTRAGRGAAGRFRDRLPMVMGWDVSGVVEAVGEGVRETEPRAGATRYRVGDAVCSFPRYPDEGATYAEYVTCPASQVAHKPRSSSHPEAAGLSLAGLTAWQALFDVADLSSGQTVLVHAAAGGVGHLAVQLARWKGASVIGTSSSHNEAFLRDLGVDEFVDYRVTRFEETLRDVDVVLDPIGGETRARSWGVLSENGILVGLVGKVLVPADAAARGVRGIFMLAHPDGAQLAEIARLVDAGHVRPTVEAVFPLAQAREAHTYWATAHTRGKIVLQVVKG